MAFGSAADRDGHAPRTRSALSDPSLCLLDLNAPALLSTAGNPVCRDRSASSPDQARNPRQALANELKAILGETGTHAAERLISRFGSVGRVMSASPEALAAILGQNHPAISAITAAKTLVRLGFQEQLVGQPIDVADPLLQNHLRAQLLCSSVERLYAVFVDHNHLYLNSEMVSIGGRRNLILDMRRLVHRALDNDATGILLAHNHPSGNSRPSPKDISETQRLARTLRSLELSLIDHLIVCSCSIYSLERGRTL